MDKYSDTDLLLAIQLQAQFNEELADLQQKEVQVLEHIENNEKKKPGAPSGVSKPIVKQNPKFKDQEKFSVSLIDQSWELIDPNPNIHDLFLTFNQQFFWGGLLGVEVKWSPRMTLCAGVCSYEGRGGLCSIRLSTPLLKLRPRKDLVETLLHEMIHAYLFVTQNNRDRDGHGPQFHEHMYRINRIAGTKISVFHSFHDEVNSYRQHIWRCDGPCRKRPPYFGLVKRAMNRPPSARDPWWPRHQMTCGGAYTKICQPEKLEKGNQNVKRPSTKDIRSFFDIKENELKKPKASKPSLEDKQNVKSQNSSVSKGKSVPSNRNEGGSSKKVDKHATDGLGVGRVPLKNASNSSVFGFGNNSSSSSSKTKSKSSSGSLGSYTQLVKRKRSETDSGENSNSLPKISNSDVFKGEGHSLKGKINLSEDERKSKFLEKFDFKSKRKDSSKDCGTSSKLSAENSRGIEIENISNNSENSSRKAKNGDPNPSTSSQSIQCPLCDGFITSTDFETHVENCMGVFEVLDSFSEIDDDNVASDITSTKSKSSNLNDSCQIIDDCEGSTIDSASGCDKINSHLIEDNSRSKNLMSTPLLYPCPICSEKFSEQEINGHAESHFA